MPKSLRELMQEFPNRVREEILAQPGRSYREIAALFGVSVAAIKRVAKQAGMQRRRRRNECGFRRVGFGHQYQRF
jgi:DNA-directed RNA polymerase specialized sigma24 family protein